MASYNIEALIRMNDELERQELLHTDIFTYNDTAFDTIFLL